MHSVLKDNVSASETFDIVAEKYFKVINKLGHEFDNSFSNFDQLKPCMSLISNPFTQVGITLIAEN